MNTPRKSKSAQPQHTRIMELNIHGIKIEIDDQREVLVLRMEDTIPFPHHVFDQLHIWAHEEGKFTTDLEADRFVEGIGEYAGRKMDERFILSRIRS